MYIYIYIHILRTCVYCIYIYTFPNKLSFPAGKLNDKLEEFLVVESWDWDWSSKDDVSFFFFSPVTTMGDEPATTLAFLLELLRGGVELLFSSS